LIGALAAGIDPKALPPIFTQIYKEANAQCCVCVKGCDQRRTMADYGTVVGYFPSQATAESAIGALKQAGFHQNQSQQSEPRVQ
jgi:hypothetical protein